MNSSVSRAHDVGAVARGGAFTLLGSVISAGMGLLLVVVVGRTLGTAGSGIVFQGIAAFTIAMSIARMGLDTTAVWLLPRLRDEDPTDARRALSGLLIPSLVLGALVGAGLMVFADELSNQTMLAAALRAMAWAMPVAALTMVALAATRALGGVTTFVVVGSIAIPSLRPPLAVLVVALGGTATGVAFTWTAPFYLAALIAVLVLSRQVTRSLGRAPRGLRWWRPTRALTRRTWSFALPRAVATALEQAMMWLDVLIVGLLAGPAAAGIYGAATRFIGAGMLLSTSLRIVVAPMYSRYLGAGKVDEAQHLYAVTTRWIVLFSTPVYIAIGLYGGTVLGLLGPAFREGATAVAVLAAGMTIVLAAGNVQSVLLMSGHSAIAAGNKTVAVGVNVGLLLLLVPHLGLPGAAVAWSVAMLVDTGLALWQVRARTGLKPAAKELWFAAATVAAGVAVPCVVSRILLGDTVTGLVVSLALGLVLHGSLLWVFRARFQLNEFAAIARRKVKRN